MEEAKRPVTLFIVNEVSTMQCWYNFEHTPCMASTYTTSAPSVQILHQWCLFVDCCRCSLPSPGMFLAYSVKTKAPWGERSFQILRSRDSILATVCLCNVPNNGADVVFTYTPPCIPNNVVIDLWLLTYSITI